MFTVRISLNSCNLHLKACIDITLDTWSHCAPPNPLRKICVRAFKNKTTTAKEETCLLESNWFVYTVCAVHWLWEWARAKELPNRKDIDFEMITFSLISHEQTVDYRFCHMTNTRCASVFVCTAKHDMNPWNANIAAFCRTFLYTYLIRVVAPKII